MSQQILEGLFEVALGSNRLSVCPLLCWGDTRNTQFFPCRGVCTGGFALTPPHPQHSLAFEEAESEGEMSEEPSHCSRLMMAWLSATSKLSFSTLPSASGRDLGRGVTGVPSPWDGGWGTESAVLQPSIQGGCRGLDPAPHHPAGLHIPTLALCSCPLQASPGGVPVPNAI